MKLTRRKWLVGATGLLLARPLNAAAPDVQVIEGPAFGASWRVVVSADIDPAPLRATLQAVIASVDAAMSPFRADSEIGRFNASDTTGWFALSSPVCDVVAAALDMAATSAGAFDPTVGGIVGQYGFGPITRRSQANHTGILLRAGAVRKLQSDLTLDLCGIAKGHALDRMVQAIEDWGLTAFLVEIGGEVAARGTHPGGRQWQVGIESPEPGTAGFQCVLMLADESLATSGDRINGYIFEDRRYGHIIDPHRRAPADARLASVSVLAPTAMRADAVATALFAMGHADGPDFARQHALDALFLVRAANDIAEIVTGSFDARVLA